MTDSGLPPGEEGSSVTQTTSPPATPYVNATAAEPTTSGSTEPEATDQMPSGPTKTTGSSDSNSDHQENSPATDSTQATEHEPHVEAGDDLQSGNETSPGVVTESIPSTVNVSNEGVGGVNESLTAGSIPKDGVAPHTNGTDGSVSEEEKKHRHRIVAALESEQSD